MQGDGPGAQWTSQQTGRRRLQKRLGKNLYRSIILAKGGKFWVFVFLFAKKDQENIEDDELEAFKKLADLYAEEG